VRTHKGLIYFKIGAFTLVLGHRFATASKWYKRAYQEDQITYHEKFPAVTATPEEHSAYRMRVIVNAFMRFQAGIRDRQVKQVVDSLVTGHQSRVGRLLVGVYDRSVQHPPEVREISGVAFDRLLGRNPYRVLVEQNYRGAARLCQLREHLEGTNLEKYGVAQAVVVLCGTTVEGVLLNKRGVRKRASRRPNLAKLMSAYLPTLRRAPELAAGLVFLWFARDMIHPDVARRSKSLVVDLNFADFVWTLTGDAVVRMARRGRPRKIHHGSP
jgi:hypothetical protein